MKKVFKYIGLVVLLLVFGVCLFIPKFAKNNFIASADTVTTDYTFDGSTLLICCTSYWTGADDENMRYGFGKFGFKITSSSTVNYTISGYLQYFPNSIEQGTPLNSTFTATTESTYNKVPLSDRFGNNTYMYCISKLSSDDFIANIVKVRIYSDIKNNEQYNTFIEYYDVNGNYLSLNLFAYSPNDSSPEHFLYSDRTYYFSNSLNLDDNSFYNQGYSDGYNNGISDNQINIYNDGYKAGNTVGYGSGYNAGVESANKYTFLSLIGAVVDAPVKAFTSLFDFEFLGFNLKSFFASILTLSLLIWVIKMFLGR